jgi:hypothetical protein
MHMRKGAPVWLPALAVVLAGCGGKDVKPVDPNLYPANYKQEILLTMPKLLSDPAHVRDAAITDPALRQAGKEQRYTVCVRANSRGQDGGYPGVKERIGYFYGGHLNQLIEAASGQCAGAVYKPFPELEKLCLAKSCPSS